MRCTFAENRAQLEQNPNRTNPNRAQSIFRSIRSIYTDTITSFLEEATASIVASIDETGRMMAGTRAGFDMSILTENFYSCDRIWRERIG